MRTPFSLALCAAAGSACEHSPALTSPPFVSSIASASGTPLSFTYFMPLNDSIIFPVADQLTPGCLTPDRRPQDSFSAVFSDERGTHDFDAASLIEAQRLAAFMTESEACIEDVFATWQQAQNQRHLVASAHLLHPPLARALAEDALWGGPSPPSSYHWRTPANHYASMTGLRTQSYGDVSSKRLEGLPVGLTAPVVAARLLSHWPDTAHNLTAARAFTDDAVRAECVELAVAAQTSAPDETIARALGSSNYYRALTLDLKTKGSSLAQAVEQVGSDLLREMCSYLMHSSPTTFESACSPFQRATVPASYRVLLSRYLVRLQKALHATTISR